MNNIKNVHLKSIKKKYNNEDSWVLKDFSYTFEKDNVYFIVGKSGIGKTTLINIVGLIEEATEGQIIIDEKDYATANEKEKHLFIKRNVSYLFQGTNLNLDFLVRDNLLMVCSNEEKINEVTSTLEINHLLNQKSLLLSKGEKARLAIARIILEEKNILLIDEPTANLDEKTAKTILKTIYQYSKDRIVLIVSHKMNEDLDFPYYVVYLPEGNSKFYSIENKKTQKKLIHQDFKNPNKHLFKTSNNLIKNNFVRLLLMTFSLFLLGIIIYLFSFVATLKPQKIIKEKLISANLNYVEVKPVPKDDDYYTFIKIPIEFSGNKENVPAYFSDDNTFYYQGNVFNLNDNEIIFPTYLAETLELTIGNIIKIGEQDVHIKEIYDDKYETYLEKFIDLEVDISQIIDSTVPIFISKNVIIDYYKTRPLKIDYAVFKELSFEIYNQIGLSIQIKTIDLQNINNQLKNNEISLILNSTYEPSIEEDLLGIINKSFPVAESKDNSFNLREYTESVFLKEIVYDDFIQYNEGLLFISEALAFEILNDIDNNKLIVNKRYMVPVTNDLNVSLEKEINSFGLISEENYQAYQTINNYQHYFYFFIVFLIIISLLLFIVISNGIFKHYYSYNLLYYTIGYNHHQRSVVLFLPLFICIVISQITILIFTNNSVLLNKVIKDNNINDADLFPKITNLYIIISLSLIVVSIFISYSLTKVKAHSVAKLSKDKNN